jgi:hypothetical protein
MNVNNLLEGAAPYQVLSEQSAKLAGKWEKSGLLEGIESSTERNNMSMLLENQAKQLVNESNTTGTNASMQTGNSEAWAGVALPLVRRVFGEIVAKDLISVQPMNLPAGLIFYLDFQYGTTDATGLKGPNESLYGAESTLKRTDGAFDKGLYGAGEFGYSMETTQSAILAIGTSAGTTATYTTASALAATTNAIAVASFVGNNLMNDSEFSSSNAAGIAAGTIFTVRVAKAGLGDFDAEGIRAFGIDDANDKITAFYPQYTRIEGDNVEFVVKVAAAAHAYGLGAVTVTYQKGPDNLNDRGDFEEGKNGTTVGGTNNSTYLFQKSTYL